MKRTTYKAMLRILIGLALFSVLCSCDDKSASNNSTTGLVWNQGNWNESDWQ